MKSTLTFLTLALLIICCQVKEVKNNDSSISKEEIQIAKDLIQGSFDNIWGGVDTSLVSNYHTEDFIILEQGEIWNNDRIKEYMNRQLANPNRAKRINSMEYISIDKYGPSIQIAYWNSAEFTQADTLVGKASWLESALAVPTDDGWRLKMMHSTRAKR